MKKSKFTEQQIAFARRPKKRAPHTGDFAAKSGKIIQMGYRSHGSAIVTGPRDSAHCWNRL